MPTPSLSRHVRQTSPPLSVVSSQAPTIGQHQRLNVVTRLAIEGKAKKGQDGAAMKVYLKISLPLESVSPGMTLALFPEENVKILTSQAHPIDGNSVPYSFSSTTSPLLRNAARALNLPAQSSISYLSLFGLSHFTSPSFGSSSRSTASNGANTPTLDERYTGHILVSGYNVSYVLPKEFPRSNSDSLMDDDGVSVLHATPVTASRRRRPSFGEKNFLQFMAAIEMWVPYISQPPMAPYLLSIPTPRCLSNHVKMRIFSPAPTAASFASLSSAEDDGGTWDLTADPPVTRSATPRLGRTNSYSHFADDESSDSSVAGFSDGCGIQGTFPSAERLRLRWAVPMKGNIPNGGDGRRKVGVREAQAEMTCVILGKGKARNNGAEGTVMNVEYKGTCKGLWFRGVATMLGMDVGLEAKGSDVTWLSESEPKWTIGGGVGYTGFDLGSLPQGRSDQFTTPQIHLLPSTPSHPDRLSRPNSASSTSSLLRAPLPAQNVPEYSFEGSVTSSGPSVTVSSIGSLPQLTPELGGKDGMSTNGTQIDTPISPPGAPITLHINMDDLLPPSKNIFTFTISGAILVTPRQRPPYTPHSRNSHLGGETDTEPIVLPRFTVFAADLETTAFIIRNEATQATLEIYNPSGDIRDAQTRKTVLQKGGSTRCGVDGARIALRSIRPPFANHETPQDVIVDNGNIQPRTTAHLPPLVNKTDSSPLKGRDGPLMIPFVQAVVTPFITAHSALPNAHAVRLCLPAPSEPATEWLELGFAVPFPDASLNPLISTAADGATALPRLHIASASIDGVPVLFETSSDVMPEKPLDLITSGEPFEEVKSKREERISCVKIHVAGRGGGNVVIDYVVTTRYKDAQQLSTARRRKWHHKNRVHLDVLLPAFTLPVGRLEVKIESDSDICIASVRSNFTHRRDGPRLLQYSMEVPFYPRLSLMLYSAGSLPNAISRTLGIVAKILPVILSLVTLFYLRGLITEVRELKRSMEDFGTSLSAPFAGDSALEAGTVTETIEVSSRSRWWFGDMSNIPASTSPADAADDWLPQSPSDEQSWTLVSIPTQTESAAESLPIGPSEQGSFILPSDSWQLSWAPTLGLPPPAREAADRLLERLFFLWQLLRKAYHYPLEPPS